MVNQAVDRTTPAVGSAEVRRILGDLQDATVARILALRPTNADLEDAAVCLAGDHDVLAKSGHHVPIVAARIVELLAEEDAVEPDR